MFRIGWLFLFLIVSSFTFSQVDEVRRITQTLCTPEFHGRGYVNGGDSIAAEFIAQEFQKAGLKPLKKSYFQSFSFPVNRFPNQAEIRQNGSELKMGMDVLVDPSSPTFHGILAPKLISPEVALNEDKLMEVLKEVLSKANYNSIALDLRTENADTLKLLRGFKYELAQFVPVIELTNAKFTWSVAGEQLKFPIFQLKGTKFEQESEFNVHLDAELVQSHTARNVIGYLPATKKAKKTIVFSAHYDHLGRLGSDIYFPGANDNASGTATIIMLADYFRKHPIEDYNLLFIAFAGEEAGLLGSKHFVEHPLLKLKKIEFLINLDILGSGEDGITVVNGSVFEEQFNELVAINTEFGLLKQVKSRGKAANSDHYWFSEKGVPAFFIYTMGTNNHYHDVFDTYEELTFAETMDITTLLMKFVEGL